MRSLLLEDAGRGFQDATLACALHFIALPAAQSVADSARRHLQPARRLFDARLRPPGPGFARRARRLRPTALIAAIAGAACHHFPSRGRLDRGRRLSRRRSPWPKPTGRQTLPMLALMPMHQSTRQGHAARLSTEYTRHSVKARAMRPRSKAASFYRLASRRRCPFITPLIQLMKRAASAFHA